MEPEREIPMSDTEKVNSGRREVFRDPFIRELEQAIQAMARAKATQEFRALQPATQSAFHDCLRTAVFELESVESAYVAVKLSKLPRAPKPLTCPPSLPPYGFRAPIHALYIKKKKADPEKTYADAEKSIVLGGPEVFYGSFDGFANIKEKLDIF